MSHPVYTLFKALTYTHNLQTFCCQASSAFVSSNLKALYGYTTPLLIFIIIKPWHGLVVEYWLWCERCCNQFL